MRDERDHPVGRLPERDPHERFPGYDGMELTTLRRYIIGDGTPAERAAIDAWAARATERRRYLDALSRLYQELPSEHRGETAAAWQPILHAMAPPTVHAMPPRHPPPTAAPAVHVHVRRPRVLSGAFTTPRRQWTLPLAVAAALVLAAAGMHLSGLTTAHRPAAVAAPMRSVTTTRGQQAQIRLGDGTYVVLGVDSRISFASDFGTRSRDVELDGTAYFRVAHDSTTPFVVHTANAVAQDLGTTFVVRAYAGDSSTQVVVAEGSVALRAAGAGRATRAVLTRNQLGLIAWGQAHPVVSAVDPAHYTAWMRGTLLFQDTPLSNVVTELRRWYDVDVRIGDASLRMVPFSASFTAESFREALATITTVLPLRAVRKGSVVMLVHR